MEGLEPHQFQSFLKEAMHAYYYNYCGKVLNVAHNFSYKYVVPHYIQCSELVRTVGACAQRVASIP